MRIFCPGRELPFAGHPTLGSCHAWLEAGGKPRGEYIMQECGVGLVRIRRDGPRLAFAAPPLKKTGPLDEDEVAVIARGLGIARTDIVAHAWCDNGPHWRGVILKSADQVLSFETRWPGSDGPRHRRRGAARQSRSRRGAGVGQETQFEVRAFFPGNNGIVEDPVTGSLNAALAQWLIGAGYAPPRYVVAQGTALGRAGRVFVEQTGNDLWIGGGSVTVVDGTVQL